jgi:hypothetical protein
MRTIGSYERNSRPGEAIAVVAVLPSPAPCFDLAPAICLAEHGAFADDAAPLRPRPPIGAIQRAFAERFGVRLNDLLSHRRTRDVAVPRHLMIALSKRLTLHTLPAIGRRTGNRDHTTILHSVNKAAPALDACGLPDDAPLSDWVEALHRVTHGGVTLKVKVGEKDGKA